MKRPRSQLAVISLLGILVLLICCFFLIGNQNVGTPVVTQKPENTGLKEKGKNAPSVQTPPASSSSVSTSASGGAGARSLISHAGQIEKNVALNSLKRWIKQREGKDVEVVDTQTAFDMNGNPASMNVLVTSRIDSSLTVEKLKEQLDAITANEHGLREQLLKSYQDGDIAAVNRLVAELSEGRTAFVASNEVTSYKISLTQNNPPVLAFWPGLPFEMVREEAARSLAAKELGNDIELQGLVHYTSATALLCFTNSAGRSIYIDPFRVAEVPLNVLLSSHERTARADDDGRDLRIADQWADFLHP